MSHAVYNSHVKESFKMNIQNVVNEEEDNEKMHTKRTLFRFYRIQLHGYFSLQTVFIPLTWHVPKEKQVDLCFY